MRACLQCQHIFSSGGRICPICKHEPLLIDGFEAHATELAHEGGRFKAEYFAELAELEAVSFWFRARNELILWALRTYKPDAQTFLEVGCGTGFVLAGIAKAHSGIDISGSEIFIVGLPHAAARVPTAHLMQMDARHVPFLEEFDAIGAFDVLEHIEEDETVLAQLHRALNPGGVLLLTVPQHPWLWSPSDDYACHVRRYKARELHDKVERAGFRIEYSTSFVSLLLPAMLLSRRKKFSVSAKHDMTSELRLPNSLNAFLLGVMRLEQYFIRCGISFPFGGSRLVVAKKVSG